MNSIYLPRYLLPEFVCVCVFVCVVCMCAFGRYVKMYGYMFLVLLHMECAGGGWKACLSL